MTKKLSDVTIDHNEASSIESPTWQTSGIASGMQALRRTAGLPVWTESIGTGIESPIEYYITPLINEEGISELLLKDERLEKSIAEARKQMRKGGPYLMHNDIFGE